MKAEVFKPGNIKKLKKDFDNINECDKPVYYMVINLFESFPGKISAIKVYRGSDIDLKIRLGNTDYRYIKILKSKSGMFEIMRLPLDERKIGKYSLYDMIRNDVESGNELKRETRNEILKYIDFNRNRKKLLYILNDSENANYYIMKETTIKDIVVRDIEYMYTKNSSYRVYNGTIPVKFIGDYWSSYLKRRKKTEMDVWKSLITQ
ncbi:hypothetical protein ACLIKE_09935 [Ferroplasma acidiphilum]|uniref:Uncharacterized protein n=2 Tax=Ferroplasma TaxID=74968 RepID=S0ARN3_FERAC|nr:MULTISPECIES: hypothetical protein [Ferroplasma]AGO60745.1 hypothetical protein FACI_IFERC00001G0765 [Ferroplasma acidarmanus Fer1]NOL60087.1 hypothetical protein [Ferroplasma acidiphilum]